MALGTYLLRGVVLCFAASLLFSCAKDADKPVDVIDQTLKMSREDYKKHLLPDTKPEVTAKLKEPSIPDVAPILVAPRRPALVNDKLVTLSVTEDVPLKDVLLELGRLSDVDMELDPNISGGVILKVKNKPFSEVIERVAKLANLRYSLENGVMKVEKDTPYLVSYPVDFPNLIRSNKGDIAVSTVVGGSGGGGESSSSSSSLGSGSSNTISSEYSGDLWGSIEENIGKILGQERPTLTASSVSSGKESDKDTAASSSGTGSAMAGGSTEGAGSDKGDSKAGGTGSSSVAINKQAGIINVFATQHQHDDIKRYLNYVKASTSAQVLIEAKIVEVTLNDEYHTGINWNVVDRNLGIGLKGDFTQNISGLADKMQFGVLDKSATGLADPTNLEAMVNMTQIFGTTRTLSSPRLHAMNNQQALLSFTQNEVYFSLDIEQTDAQVTGGTVTQPAKTTVNSTLNTVPIGIILTLQPSINMDTDEITMNIRPTLSRVTGHVVDPAVAYLVATSSDSAVATLSNTVPVVEVREMDSVLKVKSGQIMVIGGLMEERAENNDTGVPFVSTVPWVGNLFKSVGKTSDVVQTLIFIKATLVPSSGAVANEDKEFYRTFVREPKPLTF